MVRADLERLGLAHDEADLAVLLVLEELDGARPPLLPLVPLLVKPVKLRLPANNRADQRHQIEPKKSTRATREGRRGERASGGGGGAHMSRSTSSSSSPVVTATSSSRTMGATWAPVSSSSPPAAAAAAAEASSSSSGRSTTGSLSAIGGEELTSAALGSRSFGGEGDRGGRGWW